MNKPQPCCCLTAEDQARIGWALQAYLENFGFSVAGPFASCADALDWAERKTPDVAILDFKLKDGPCTELAKVPDVRRYIRSDRWEPGDWQSCVPASAPLLNTAQDRNNAGNPRRLTAK